MRILTNGLGSMMKEEIEPLDGVSRVRRKSIEQEMANAFDNRGTDCLHALEVSVERAARYADRGGQGLDGETPCPLGCDDTHRDIHDLRLSLREHARPEVVVRSCNHGGQYR